jgi:DedD protein
MPLPPFLQRFRPGASSPAPQSQPMSDADVEFARVKARRRMIGMAVLVLAGVVGFPWLFETQPRPLSNDVQVISANAVSGAPALVIPAPRVPVTGRVETAPAAETEVIEAAPSVSASKVEPESAAGRVVALASEVAPAASTAHVSDAASKAAAAKAQADAKARHEAKAKAKLDAKAHAEAKAKAEEKAHDDKAKALAKTKADEKSRLETKAQADAKAKATAQHTNANAKAEAKPEARAENKTDAKAATDTRYIVQVGAFSDANMAQAARAKVEKLGIKTYTQEVSTPAGKKIRVRVGPFANKAEADKATATLKKAGLVAAVLTL